MMTQVSQGGCKPSFMRIIVINLQSVPVVTPHVIMQTHIWNILKIILTGDLSVIDTLQ